MKSVTVKDIDGELLFRVSVTKRGGYAKVVLAGLNLKIDVRDESGKKVWFG